MTEPALEPVLPAMIGAEILPLILLALAGVGSAFVLLPRARTPGALRFGFVVAMAGGLAALVLLLASASIIAGTVVPPWATGLGVATAAVLAAVRLWGWLQGVSVVLSGRARIGDHLAVGGRSGHLQRAGLLRAEVIGGDGTVWSAPWSVLGREVLGVSPSAGPRRVDVVLKGLPDHASDSRRRVERATALCPFRVWTRPVEVRLDAAADTLEVSLWTWSNEAAPLAEDFVREAARRALEGETG